MPGKDAVNARVYRSDALALAAVILGWAWASFAAGPEPNSLLTTNDTAAIGTALHRLNMTGADLAFDKDAAKPRWTLQWVRDTLKAPLELPAVGGRIRAAATGETAGVWRLAADLLEAKTAQERPVPADVEFSASNSLNPHLAGFVAEFVDQAAVARQAVDNALAGVPPARRSYVAASILSGLVMVEDHPEVLPNLVAAGMASGDVARVLGEAIDLDPEPAASNVLDAVLGVDMGELLRGGQVLHAAVLRLAEQARSVREWPAAPAVFGTALGRLVIGTPGADRYTEPAVLILDPGGDDDYGGDTGVANGLKGNPLAAILDLGGDDIYNGTGLCGAGSALFGVSVLVDEDGNDVYRAATAGQGAAVGGAAWVEDRAGDDTYRGGVLCQGAAVAGLGVLEDAAGSDVYEVGLAGQAYSGVRGAGLLIDRAGDDRYLAGSRDRDWGRHPDRYLSLSQGFSIGVRPFCGGGVAALVDLDGNDTYAADIFGQGVSYWYSAGFLLDAAGNDTYRMFHYGQGSGIHLSLGLLSDEAGDDSYTGAILAQGNAHDYAVGMLIDRGGNDVYTADSASQGRALYNAFALLLDGAGNDAYFATHTNECQGLGHDGGPREYGDVALLVDESGADQYSCGASNAAATLRPWYGVVLDIDPALPPERLAGSGLRAMSHAAEGAKLREALSAAATLDTAPSVRGYRKAGGSAVAAGGDRGLAAAARLATEKKPEYAVPNLQWPALSIEQVLVLAQHPGNRVNDQAIRTDAEQELAWRGPAALEGMMRYAHLENINIQLRTQGQVDSLSGAVAAPILARFLDDVHPRTRRLAAYYLGMYARPEAEVGGGGGDSGRARASGPAGEAEDKEARQGCRRPTQDGRVSLEAILLRLRTLLDDDEAAGAAIRTLGKWRDRESVARIAGFLANVKETRRVAAANALRDIGDPAAVPALLSALRDPVFTVRLTAQRALIALGEPAEKAALQAWHAADPATRRHLLGVLAAGDSRAAWRVIDAARHDPDDGVRIDAAMLWRER